MNAIPCAFRVGTVDHLVTATGYLLRVDDLDLPAVVQRDEGAGWCDVFHVSSLDNTTIVPLFEGGATLYGRYVIDFEAEGTPTYRVKP